MPARTHLARLARSVLPLTCVAAPLLAVGLAGPAAAHGAPTGPVSRAAACGSDGSARQTPACRAARAGTGGQWFDQWDNVRVADVNGRDRQTIPNGKLCSGGIAGFGGLDLARPDWPTTKVRAGRALTVSYRATIPHEGTFRVYVTKNGYDPSRRLRWTDLESTPFLTAKDPSFSGGAYRFKGTLPRGKTGRHVVYTIWQNSSTADTYYSCSDVLFPKAATATTLPSTAAPAPERKVRPKATRSPRPTTTRAAPTGTPSVEPTTDPAPTAETVSTELVAQNAAADESSDFGKPVLAGLGLIALAGTGGAAVLTRRARRRR